ncbi:uncharacterized protein LOC131163368 [Malania oleifera]|uniref:uncharacterized protein LOC131163368 n=1 Tax=Malania oleifera TaxID=397392 RepID=UPI0025AE18BB|nr:uncharacterized protein LOC131163368 [Malania oleifera]
MTGDKSKFTSLRLKYGGYITFGDNAKGKIIGISKIGKESSLTIDDVLQVRAEIRKDAREKNCPTADKGSSIKEFMRMKPLAFVGGLDQVAKEKWVQEIEEILEVLSCTDEQKVRYAAFKMIGDLKRWWLSVKLLEEQILVKIALTWERLKELFFERYFSLSNREKKIEEITNLIQGDMIIAECAAKFVDLSCFAPFLISNKVQNFSNLVDKASVLEKSIQSGTEPAEQKKRASSSQSVDPMDISFASRSDDTSDEESEEGSEEGTEEDAAADDDNASNAD